MLLSSMPHLRGRKERGEGKYERLLVVEPQPDDGRSWVSTRESYYRFFSNTVILGCCLSGELVSAGGT